MAISSLKLSGGLFQKERKIADLQEQNKTLQERNSYLEELN